METMFTAVIRRDGQDWIGWIAEVPGVNCQGRTRQALIQSLKVTLSEALEVNRQDARAAMRPGFEEVSIVPAFRQID